MLASMAALQGDVSAIGLRLPSPLAELSDERLAARGVRLLLKRDDLIHPELTGNKWRKLELNLTAAIDGGHQTVLTFGGAYSNHIRATAAAGYFAGLRTIGVIRGEEHLPLNPSLAYASARGMQFSYLDRTSYRDQRNPDLIARLGREFGDFYLLPEGGSNAEAVRGCAEVPGEIGAAFDVLVCPVGTGGTLAGFASGLASHQRALGIAVLKGADFLDAEVKRLQEVAFGMSTTNWSIANDFHFGGYAKRTPELDAFIDDFATRHGLALDWVYVAKMMAAIYALVDRGAFEEGTTIVAVITGSAEIPAALSDSQAGGL